MHLIISDPATATRAAHIIFEHVVVFSGKTQNGPKLCQRFFVHNFCWILMKILIIILKMYCLYLNLDLMLPVFTCAKKQ